MGELLLDATISKNWKRGKVFLLHTECLKKLLLTTKESIVFNSI